MHTTRQTISLAALAIGVALFIVTLRYVDFGSALALGRRLGVAIPLALLVSGAWHVTRTLAWSWCFERPRRVSFLRLARVRLAAEAFSYLTIGGFAGEPLKVVLLGDRVDPREATAAVALERISYVVGTALLAGICAGITLATQPLSPLWIKIFRGLAIGSAALATAIVLIVVRRDSYLLAALRAADRAAGAPIAASRAGRFTAAIGARLGELVCRDASRLAVLTGASALAYGCLAAEAYLILHAIGVPITGGGALALETFSRMASFATTFIPADIGALEASSLAAAAAVHAAAAGAPLALARRIRGLFWAGVGLAIYPRRTAGAVTENASVGAGRRSADRGEAPRIAGRL